MTAYDRALDRIGRWIAGWIDCPCPGYEPQTSTAPSDLRDALQPGDVLLVEGNSSVATAIKYLTQSSWSHAALFVGSAAEVSENNPDAFELVEANLGEGTVAVPLSKYGCYNTRICRPTLMTRSDRDEVIKFAVARLGTMYDTRNIIDLARYLVPTPPVPVRWRRKMIALGSGQPTRFICSTLIAQAFHSVGYPILPFDDETLPFNRVASHYSAEEFLHVRHHSLYTPRDFDLSPFFEIIKPPASLKSAAGKRTDGAFDCVQDVVKPIGGTTA